MIPCLLAMCLTASPAVQNSQLDPAPKQSNAPAAPPAPARPNEENRPGVDEDGENRAVGGSADETTATPGDGARGVGVVSSAKVLGVKGRADRAAAGTSPVQADGWTAIHVADELPPGTMIRTGLRSSVTLQFGETTTVSVRSASFASVDQFFRSTKQETVRVGLGYGTVRGGSSEGTIKSSVEVDTPVATLAKRGTEGWQIEVESGTGRFVISLAEFGLVEALHRLNAAGGRQASRTVRPGEYVSEATIGQLWIEQEIFDRKVWYYDPNGQTEVEADFAAGEVGGYDSLGPGSGRDVGDLSARHNGDFAVAQYRARASRVPLAGGFDMLGTIDRPEGNFGTAASFKLRRSAHSVP